MEGVPNPVEENRDKKAGRVVLAGVLPKSTICYQVSI